MSEEAPSAELPAPRKGDSYSFSRTFTDGDVSLYCGLTGDYNPFHLDETFAAASRFGSRIVPGLLTGSLMTHVGGMLGMLGAEMKFASWLRFSLVTRSLAPS